MAKLALINGLPRMTAESAALPDIYDDYLTVVSSGASGANEINLADAEAGDNITLPNSGSYEGDDLEVYLNGNLLDVVFDYNYVGTGTRTQITLTFDAAVDDVIRFRKTRDV